MRNSICLYRFFLKITYREIFDLRQNHFERLKVVSKKFSKKICHIYSKLSTFFISRNRFLIIFWVFFTIKVRSKAIRMTEPKIIPTVSEQQQQHDVSKGFSITIEGVLSKIKWLFNQFRHGGTSPIFKIPLKIISHRFRVIRV